MLRFQGLSATLESDMFFPVAPEGNLILAH